MNSFCSLLLTNALTSFIIIQPTSSPSKAPTNSPTGPSVTKWMCANKPKSQAEICLDGTESSAVCPSNTDCGNGNKYCQSALCPGTSGPNPPTPTPPTTTPPPVTCGSTGDACTNKWDCCSQSCVRVDGTKKCS